MTAPPSRAVKLFGTEAPPAETRLLSAGPLTAELDAGNLRYIRFGGLEAIRAISYVVRDQYWGTFDPRIEDFEVEESRTASPSPTRRSVTTARRPSATAPGSPAPPTAA